MMDEKKNKGKHRRKEGWKEERKTRKKGTKGKRQKKKGRKGTDDKMNEVKG